MSHPRHRVPKTRNAFALPTCGYPNCSCGQQPCLGDNVLERLAPQEQEVVILSSFYGLAKDEIAGIIGASVHAVEALMNQALDHLRRLLPPSIQGPQAA